MFYKNREHPHSKKLISLLFISVLITLSSCNSDKYIYNEGSIYGTFYHIVYQSKDGIDLQSEIDKKLADCNSIFSTYDHNSTISKVNKNEEVELESEFITCFNRAMEISKITEGAFDITAGSLVSAWGFGPDERRKMTKARVDSLLKITGYEKIELLNNKIIKKDSNITIDMSAIAKGYTCDIIANYLNGKGCQNYMVEIGGEVVTKGVNEKKHTWRIGINKPDDDAFFTTPVFEAKVELPNNALATSGNYRNYYVEDGVKYAHTIDPKTGYPVQHEIVSSTVLANDCMTADAFATAFMVMGLDKSIQIAEEQKELEVFFIYTDDNDSLHHYKSSSFDKYIVN